MLWFQTNLGHSYSPSNCCCNVSYDSILCAEPNSSPHEVRGGFLSVLKAWVGLFLVKIDMLSWWLHFSNTQQCVGTIYILWIEVCLVIKKKVATFWKTAHVSKRTANGKPHPAITWAQKAQHLDITNRGLSGSIINYSLSSNFLPGRIA